MVKTRGMSYLFFIFISKKRGLLERGLKERGLNIEFTVPLFLPLPSQT
jgi:hypothetical protein